MASVITEVNGVMTIDAAEGNELIGMAIDEWKEDYRFLTELVLVLNHKIWQHHGHNALLAQTYDRLWREADQYAVDNLTGDALMYYYEITD